MSATPAKRRKPGRREVLNVARELGPEGHDEPPSGATSPDLGVLEEPATLYRLYRADGTLLYVGVSGSALRRLREHGRDAAWWLEVSFVRLEHYPTRDEALLAESLAIARELPVYNDRAELERIRRRASRPRRHGYAALAREIFGDA